MCRPSGVRLAGAKIIPSARMARTATAHHGGLPPGSSSATRMTELPYPLIHPGSRPIAALAWRTFAPASPRARSAPARRTAWTCRGSSASRR